ncbi:hypothetical protein IAR55_004008 [Kwoniella newhampshirensis]|uniref:Uncharacterized protein n=1 Tax=Kwoniella newhampshirensis TaxID=1651941 RepID=A0AAW0YL79_9TREE
MPSKDRGKPSSSSSSSSKQRERGKSSSSLKKRESSSRNPSSSSTGAKSKSSSSSSRPISSDQIREEEYQAWVQNSLTTHAGFLEPLIQSISSFLSLPLTKTLILILSLFILAHLYLPLFLIPHLASALTLVIPIQNTTRCLRSEIEGKGRKTDTGQWLVYWMVFCVLGWGRGWIAIFRPGWKGFYELGRSAGLVLVGGGWYGRAALRSEKSKALIEAEQREEAEQRKALDLEGDGKKKSKQSSDSKKDEKKKSGRGKMDKEKQGEKAKAK